MEDTHTHAWLYAPTHTCARVRTHTHICSKFKVGEGALLWMTQDRTRDSQCCHHPTHLSLLVDPSLGVQRLGVHPA